MVHCSYVQQSNCGTNATNAVVNCRENEVITLQNLIKFLLKFPDIYPMICGSPDHFLNTINKC